MIRLSFIVPVYNSQPWLAGCLNSICLQASRFSSEVEVWVVDDGSTDRSGEIVDKYSKLYPDLLRVIRKDNGGLSSARNAALDRCSGEFVWFVDSDDKIAEDCLGRVMSVLTRTQADYVYFEAEKVGESGQVLEKIGIQRAPTDSPYRVRFSAEGIRASFRMHMVWLRIFRRELIGSIRFPIGATHEDVYFDLRVLAKEPMVEFVTEKWYLYTDNPLSITNTMTLQKFQSFRWVYDELERFFRESNVEREMYVEYLLLATRDLYGAVRFFPAGSMAVDLPANERKLLFYEFARSIRGMLIALRGFGHDHRSVPEIDRSFILPLIAKGRIGTAYWLRWSYNVYRRFYTALSRSTHGYRSRLRHINRRIAGSLSGGN